MTVENSRYQEFKVTSDDLVSRVREYLHEGNVNRLHLKNEAGETFVEVPLGAGVAIATAGALIAPALVAVGAVAALFSHVTIGVERHATDGGEHHAADDVPA